MLVRNIRKNTKAKKIYISYIISPSDYYNFLSSLKNQKLESFKSQFEENLVRYTQSRKVVSEKQTEKSKEDQELLELYEGELSKAIKNLTTKNLKMKY